MPTAIRTVTFTVTETGITPAAPQWAGIQGEHQATKVVFVLPEALHTDEYRFRVEWVDGTQSFFSSGFLTAENGQVGLLLPATWTAAGGTGEIRLAASLKAGQGDAGQTVYSIPGRLTFSNRDEGTDGSVTAENGLDFLLSEAEKTLENIRHMTEVTDTGGLITFGDKAALAYGAEVTTAGEDTEITLPCAFSDVCYVQVGTDEGLLPILSRSGNTFTVYTEESSIITWIAVGNLSITV